MLPVGQRGPPLAQGQSRSRAEWGGNPDPHPPPPGAAKRVARIARTFSLPGRVALLLPEPCHPHRLVANRICPPSLQGQWGSGALTSLAQRVVLRLREARQLTQSL